jgi:hypothetical protein
MTLPTLCVRPALPQSSTKTRSVDRHNVEGPERLWLDQTWDARVPFACFLAAGDLRPRGVLEPSVWN